MYTVYLRFGYMHAVIANVIRTSSSSVGKLAFSRRRQMLVPVDLLCAADISAVCWARLLFCLMPGTRRRQNRIRQIRQSRPNVQRFVASSFFGDEVCKLLYFVTLSAIDVFILTCVSIRVSDCMCVWSAVFHGCLLVKLHILVKFLLYKLCYHLDGK